MEHVLPSFFFLFFFFFLSFFLSSSLVAHLAAVEAYGHGWACLDGRLEAGGDAALREAFHQTVQVPHAGRSARNLGRVGAASDLSVVLLRLMVMMLLFCCYSGESINTANKPPSLFFDSSQPLTLSFCFFFLSLSHLANAARQICGDADICARMLRSLQVQQVADIGGLGRRLLGSRSHIFAIAVGLLEWKFFLFFFFG
jgi:hypothetical protein